MFGFGVYGLRESWLLDEWFGLIATLILFGGVAILRFRGYHIWAPFFIPGGDDEAVVYADVLVIPGQGFGAAPLRLPHARLTIDMRSSSTTFRLDGKIVREIEDGSFASVEDRVRFIWALRQVGEERVGGTPRER